MAARFRRECPHQEDDRHPADHGNQNDPGAPWRGRRVEIRVIDAREPAEEKQVVNDSNQAAKQDCAESGYRPHQYGDEIWVTCLPRVLITAPSELNESGPGLISIASARRCSHPTRLLLDSVYPQRRR